MGRIRVTDYTVSHNRVEVTVEDTPITLKDLRLIAYNMKKNGVPDDALITQVPRKNGEPVTYWAISE